MMRRPLLYHQIYQRLRESILSGQLRRGDRLPSTRDLAADAGISRKTAEEAYAQLRAEGFVVRRAGSGSYVADVESMQPKTVREVLLTGSRKLSQRGRVIGAATACVEPSTVRAFAAASAALEAFPVALWQQLISRNARRIDESSLTYGDPAGHEPLREAVAAYLGNARGVRCDASQVVIVSSSQQALDLVARLVVDPGNEAWVEDPGYPGAKAALSAAGAKLIPVHVDDEGLDVGSGIAQAPNARLAYVTPSNQYPLGVTMSLERRLLVLDWAQRAGAWIVEDDYDSEFRYDSRPLSSIQGLDRHGRVIYIGTFTKVLYPSLRLGYLVLPKDLVQPFIHARTQIDGHPSTFMQSVVADFIAGGHFAAHIRRMRTLYRARRDVFVEAAQRHLRGKLELINTDAGLRATGLLTSRRDDREISRRAERAGIEAPPLSRYSLAPHPRRGLVLGYAALSPHALRNGLATLATVIT